MASQDKHEDQHSSGSNSSRLLTARPAYFLTEDSNNIPFQYWKHNLTQKAKADDPFYETNQKLLSEKQNVDDILISTLNADGHAGVIITEFLQNHYDKYCADLMEGEDVSLFFDYLINLLEARKEEFKRNTFKSVLQWVNKHEDYIPKPPATPAPRASAISLYDEPNNLTLRQIALVIHRQDGLTVDSVLAGKLLRNSKNTSKRKLKQHYNDFVSGRGTYVQPDLLEGSAQTNMIEDLIAAYPYLTGKARVTAKNEIEEFRPKLKLPV